MEKTRLFHDLKKRTIVTTGRKSCQQELFINRKYSARTPVMVHIVHKNVITDKDEATLNKWIQMTRHTPRLRSHCRLGMDAKLLKELVSPRAIVSTPEKTKYIRMFHGARSQHLYTILKDGLRTLGRGVLGNGFYMTPSLEKALLYTSKAQQLTTGTNPIVIEMLLPMDTTVCCIDPNNRNACCTNANLFTEYNDVWQFVCKDESFLKGILYQIWVL